MRRTTTVLCLVLLVLALAPGGPAKAATYTILGSTPSSPGVTARTFTNAGCTTDLASSSTNGVDGIWLTVSSWAGRPLTIRWSTDAPVVGNGLTATFYGPGCSGPVGAPGSAKPGLWTVNVPGHAAYIVIEANGTANVRVDF